MSIQWQDVDGFQKMVRRLESSNSDPSRVMRAISLRMSKMQDNHFKTEEDAEGTPWKPHSPVTIMLRRNKPNTIMGESGMPKLLEDTGVMKASISQTSGRYYAITGTNDPKATAHQYGKGKIPARQFIYLNDTEQVALVTFISNELIGKPIRGR